MRAQFMQSKYGKSVALSADKSPQLKIEGPNTRSSSQASPMLSSSKSLVQPKVEEHKKPMKLISRVSNQQEATARKDFHFDSAEPLRKKCKRFQISWLTPPEMWISKAWSVGSGKNSKEVEVQKNRIRREKGVTYKTVQEIPLNPKEPRDSEMDHDDTLTPEIPIERLPDGDGVETGVSALNCQEIALTNGSTSGTSENSDRNMPEPDLELLAILLKNPELVFALQGGNLSSEHTVKLLEMIKANGVSSVDGLINGLVDRKAKEKVEVSLPSPTPSRNPATSGWRPETAENPFSRKNVTGNGEAYAIPRVSSQKKLPAGRFLQPQIPIDSMAVPQQSPTIPPLTQNAFLPSTHQRTPMSPPDIQTWASDMVPSWKNVPGSNLPLQNLLTPASPSMRDNSVAPVKSSVVANTPSAAFFLPPSLPTPAPTQTHPQPPVIAEPRVLADSWKARQGLASNTYSQANHNNYDACGGGLVGAQPGCPWERNEYRSEPGFQSCCWENRPILLPPSLPAPAPTQTQRQPPIIAEPRVLAHSWRAREGLASNTYSQANPNNYNAYGGGLVAAQPGPWERNEYRREPGFESCNPANSPIRSQDYMAGWSYLEPGMNMGQNYRPESGRTRNRSGYCDHGWNGNPRWRDWR